MTLEDILKADNQTFPNRDIQDFLERNEKHIISGVQYCEDHDIDFWDMLDAAVIDHTNEILDEVRKSREFKKWANKDVDLLANYAAEDFMRNADIDRAGKGSGFSSFDRAYLTVRNIVNIADKVGSLEKTNSKRLEID